MRRDHWASYWNGLAQAFGDRPALRADDLNGHLTYRELAERAGQLAAALARLGVGLESRVITRLPNTSIAPLVHIALLLTGACEIPVAHGASEQELGWIAQQAGASLVLARMPSAALPDGVPVVDPDILPRGSALVLGDGDADIATLPGRALPSSGTTGMPKVSVYSHQARLAAHRLQCELMPCVPAAESELLLATPFSHGASLLALAWWHFGGQVVLFERADAPRLVQHLRRGAGAIFAPPTLLNKLLDEAGPGPLHAKTVFTGTQQLDARLYRRARDAFGPAIRVTYGKSECINPICYTQPEDTDRAYRDPDMESACCVGVPAPGVHVEVRSEDGAVLPAGVHGTVWIKAAHMSEGTWHESRLKAWEDGWHHTEDRGYQDDAGRLWLLGRQGDAIKTGGYLVQLDAVDAIAGEIDRSVDCCAVALPSGYWGSVIALAVVGPAAGIQFGLDSAFSGHGRQMRPRLVLEVEEIPRNPQGKIMRAALVKRVLAQYELVDGAYPALATREPAP
ncbi:class I adenylate-forming enzyme family protein [Parapusillimonas sp. JC17]|uniref:class I adenylate-forming enzyme family protein n=1 Tax=Parapusillimonas sp. JC17 TaxID=3445768 RepID=UPI003FA09A7C